MFSISLLNKKGIEGYLDTLKEEISDIEIRNYESFLSVDSDTGSAYVSSVCGNVPLRLRIKLCEGAWLEIPSDYIDAIYRL